MYCYHLYSEVNYSIPPLEDYVTPETGERRLINYGVYETLEDCIDGLFKEISLKIDNVRSPYSIDFDSIKQKFIKQSEKRCNIYLCPFTKLSLEIDHISVNKSALKTNKLTTI